MRLKGTYSSIKLKEIFLPFILIGFCTVFSYAVFRWVFDVKLGLLHIDEKYLNFWLPLTLPWIPILIWMRPRLRILKKKEWSRSDNYMAIQWIMSLAIGFPSLISQEYIIKASYDLTRIHQIEQIAQYPAEKYFHLESFILNNDEKASHITSGTSGKRNQYLNYHIYEAIPFRRVQNVYLAFHYQESISNKLSDFEKNKAYRVFLQNATNALEIADFYSANYFEKVPHSKDLKGYIKAIETQVGYALGDEVIVLRPLYIPYEQRLGSKGFWIFASSVLGIAIVFLFVHFSKVDQRRLKRVIGRT